MLSGDQCNHTGLYEFVSITVLLSCRLWCMLITHLLHVKDMFYHQVKNACEFHTSIKN